MSDMNKTMDDMTSDQFRAAIKRIGFATSGREDDAGLSAFARWLPCEPKSVRRWASGETGVPPAIAKLLRVMVKLKLDPSDVK